MPSTIAAIATATAVAAATTVRAAAGDMARGGATASPATAAAAVPSMRGTARSHAAEQTVDLGTAGGGIFRC